MDNTSKDILLAKIHTLQGSVSDSVIDTLCDILIQIVKANSGEPIGFKMKE